MEWNGKARQGASANTKEHHDRKYNKARNSMSASGEKSGQEQQVASEATALVVGMQSFTSEQMRIIKSQICKNASDDELAYFVATANRLRLDPFAKQIWGIMRPTKDGKVLSIQVSIDGFRLIAERTGKYEGQAGPFWCGPDKKWTDVWLSDEPPSAARVGVIKVGAREATFVPATYHSYVQRDRDGNPVPIWKKMPEMMLAKCAESLALRKMFPNELSGIYTPEEMAGQDNIDNPKDPDALSDADKKLVNNLLDEVFACMTVEEIDHIEEKLKGMELSKPIKRSIWPLYKKHRENIEARENGVS